MKSATDAGFVLIAATAKEYRIIQKCALVWLSVIIYINCFRKLCPVVKLPTVKLSFQKQRTEDSFGYLYIIILLSGQRKYLKRSLGYKIEEKHWDKTRNCVKPSCIGFDFINTDINAQVNDIIKHFQVLKLNKQDITRQVIETALNGNGKSDFVDFFQQFIIYISQARKSKTDNNKRYSDNNVKKWQGILNRLKRYQDKECSGMPIHFAGIDVMWMERYEAWNAKELDKDTSLPVLMSRTRQILKKASEKGLFNMAQIAGYRSPVYKNPDRGYLTIAEIDTIWDEIPKFESRVHEVVACFFLIECLSGLRFSDWMRFTLEKLIDTNRIKVSAKKNGEPVYFPYHKSPRLKRVIEYIEEKNLICNYAEPTVNEALKEIAAICKIKKKITTHIGRHTFATLMLDLGYSEATIAEWMAVSEKTVKIYAKRIRTAANREYEEKGGL
ncbi:phage integrase SAM-like domain-containing protein [Candidatus Dependentiae bacterium]|nr:phage integrase SAM-like domain-containing protein [Candidatus Dependentiae bacterium]